MNGVLVNVEAQHVWLSIPVCVCECDKTCGIREHLDINNCTWKEPFIDNVLSREDEILKTTETASIVDKNYFYFLHTIFVSSHFYQLLLLLYKTLAKKEKLITLLVDAYYKWSLLLSTVLEN